MPFCPLVNAYESQIKNPFILHNSSFILPVGADRQRRTFGLFHSEDVGFTEGRADRGRPGKRQSSIGAKLGVGCVGCADETARRSVSRVRNQ